MSLQYCEQEKHRRNKKGVSVSTTDHKPIYIRWRLIQKKAGIFLLLRHNLMEAIPVCFTSQDTKLQRAHLISRV